MRGARPFSVHMSEKKNLNKITQGNALKMLNSLRSWARARNKLALTKNGRESSAPRVYENLFYSRRSRVVSSRRHKIVCLQQHDTSWTRTSIKIMYFIFIKKIKYRQQHEIG